MQRRAATDAMRECVSHVDRLLDRIAGRRGGESYGPSYGDDELLALLPAIEAQASEIGVTVAMLRTELQRKLDKEPADG